MKLSSLLIIPFLLLSGIFYSSAKTQAVPDWGNASTVNVYGQYLNITGDTFISGNVVSVQPTSYSGTSPGLINGSLWHYITNSSTYTYDPQSFRVGVAFADANDIEDELWNTAYYSTTTDLSGKTLGEAGANNLTPGTYTFSSDANLAGTLTLDDLGDKNAFYIFRISGNFTTASASIVQMKSGGYGANVYFTPVGNTDLGINSYIIGNVLSRRYPQGTITVEAGAVAKGRLFTVYGTINIHSGMIDVSKDFDGDGVPDNLDDYPADATRAYNNFSDPATIAFEDQWPLVGDFDMNDVVMKYAYNVITNAENNVVEVQGYFNLMATGGKLKNAFGIEFPVATRIITSVPAGTLEPGQEKAVFMLYSDMRSEMSNYNTIPNQPMSDPIKYMVDFNIDPATKITIDGFNMAGYNPFIVNYTGTSRREIHLSGMKPTSLADRSVFGTNDDASNLNSNVSYVTKDGLPWAIVLPTDNFNYPVEKMDISTVYLHFGDWAMKKGNLYIDWFSNLSDGYRNNSFIYIPVKK